jgi:hypothetical protein
LLPANTIPSVALNAWRAKRLNKVVSYIVYPLMCFKSGGGGGDLPGKEAATQTAGWLAGPTPATSPEVPLRFGTRPSPPIAPKSLTPEAVFCLPWTAGCFPSVRNCQAAEIGVLGLDDRFINA